MTPHYDWVADTQTNFMMQIQNFAAVDDRMRQIKTDSHIRVRQNRTLFNSSAEINVRIRFDSAATRYQTVVRNPHSMPDVRGCDDSRVACDLRYVCHP